MLCWIVFSLHVDIFLFFCYSWKRYLCILPSLVVFQFPMILGKDCDWLPYSGSCWNRFWLVERHNLSSSGIYKPTLSYFGEINIVCYWRARRKKIICQLYTTVCMFVNPLLITQTLKRSHLLIYLYNNTWSCWFTLVGKRLFIKVHFLL